MADWHITIDQFGYRIGDAKVAVIADPQEGFNDADRFSPGRVYQVRRSADSAVMFVGEPVAWNDGQTDPLSGDRAWWFDFSPLIEPGAYYVYDVENNVMSYEFRIGDDVYERVLYHALRMYYYQREGIAHEAPFADYPWFDGPSWVHPGQDREARDVFAPDDASRARDVSGGWMDAGDTNKYVTFIDSCIHELLATYETNPAFFREFSLDIPESPLDAPDILSEIKWELDWLCKMQNDDGSAHLKAGMHRANASSPPSKDTTPRVYHGVKSSAAAIALAGVFAHAARVYQTVDLYRAYGEELGRRAERSWDWYQECVRSGTRNDEIDHGEVLSGRADRSLAVQDATAVAAAIQLYALTGAEKYHDHVRQNYLSVPPLSAGDGESGFIGSVRQLGLSLAHYLGLPGADPVIVQNVKAAWVSAAEHTESPIPYRFVPEQSAYRAYIAEDAVTWGHLQHRGVRGYDSHLLAELGLAPGLSRDLVENAANQLHHIHGVNPLGVTYLTNMYSAGASRSVKYLYHEWFMDVPGFGMAAPPGYLVGGPNTHTSYAPPKPSLDDVLERRESGDGWQLSSEGRTGPYANDAHYGLPSRLSPPQGQPPLKAYLDAPHFFGVARDTYGGFTSFAWTEPMCAYQSTYVRLLACFVGRPSALRA
ncbi:MAG: glycoside hydrolase family 9 protein [Microbacteriaceae bacterium]|nr:glycoside hydrolase family 9 protein [Microbacteriaceae bacterium]MCL2795786.1 glycoside hydrolase family 9 protein [Microbacteriaceae bacterium]